MILAFSPLCAVKWRTCIYTHLFGGFMRLRGAHFRIQKSHRLRVRVLLPAIVMSLLGFSWTLPADALLIGEPNAPTTRNALIPQANNVLAINSGGPAYVDSRGINWQADQYFLPGTGGTNSTPQAISGTDDAPIFQTERWGTAGYDIPLPNGNYTLQLSFAEINPTSGTRVFDVSANGTLLLDNYNISQISGNFAATVETFPLTVSGGALNLRLAAIQNATSIAGIQIYTAGADSCPENQSILRINAGGPAVTDSQGRAWVADAFSQGGGGSHSVTTAIAGTQDQSIFQSERWGSTGYNIPIPNDSYNVALSFAELNPTSGSRVFDVSVEGALVVNDLKITSEVGNYTALTKTFPATVTDGFLQIGLTAVQNATSIVGIEVLTSDKTANCIGQSVFRMNAGGPEVTTTDGQVWAADAGHVGGGGTNVTTQAIAGTSEQSLFQSERWGSDGYDIPIGNGDYNIKLGFAEINPSSGPRVFDLALNGVPVAIDLNISSEAGGAYKALVKTYPVRVTSGVIQLRFEATQNATTISSIELVTALYPASGQWSLSMGDLFDGNSVDESKWGIYAGKGNEGVGQRTPDNAKVHDGELELQGTEAYYGAGVSMRLNQTYGRVVVRAKTDYGNGYGPALLMWPQSEEWPEDGEIDISEIPKGERNSSHFTLHWGENNSQDGTSTSGDFTGWHTWVLEWQPDHISGWIDGQLIKTVTKPEAIPTGPMHLALQQDVGADGHWIPGTDENTPEVVSLHIAYAAVFQNANTKSRTVGSEIPPDLEPEVPGNYQIIGPILDKYNQLGAGVVGLPTGKQQRTSRRTGLDGVWQSFQKGKILFSAETGAHFVPNGILQRAYLNNCAFFCHGLPVADQMTTAGGLRLLKTQFGGTIFAAQTAKTFNEVHSIRDQVLAKYEALGLDGSFLGSPLANTKSIPDGHGGVGLISVFQGGTITWSSTAGTHEVHGAIRAKWNELGGTSSALGFPTSDEHDAPGGRQSDFEHGSIFWNSITHVVTVTINP